MENKNSIAFYSLIFLVVGIILGWLIWGMPVSRHTGMHMMPDGSLMNNDGSPASMDSMMMDMTAHMNGKTRDELDRVFLEDMIVHHQGAVDMAKLLAAGTKRLELQKMAQDIITVQTKEIKMMQDWQKQWFNK